MNPRMKILVVADTLDVNSSSGAKGRIALIKALNKCNFDLKVLHYSRKSIHLKGILIEDIVEKRNTFTFIVSKIVILLKKLFNYNLKPWIEKKNGFSFAHDNDVFSIKKAILKEDVQNYNWILALSYAGSFRAHKAILNLPTWHNKFLAYIHDPYPQHSFPRPYDWVEPGHQQKRDFFLKVAQYCAYAIYPSDLLGEWMEGYYKTLIGKRVVIPHQLDKKVIDKTNLPDTFDSDKFTILHAGTLFEARNPIALMDALKRLWSVNTEAQSEVQLLFIGGSSYFDAQINEAKKLFPQIKHLGKLDFETTLAMQYYASVNIILEAKGPISPFLPGKFPHCVLSDNPILLLGPHCSEVKRLMGEDYPYWSENDDEDKIYNILVTLYKMWKTKPEQYCLDRKDIEFYLSEKYLEQEMAKLN